MKIILVFLIALSIALTGKAQNIDDAKRFIYYERYKSAENLLHTILKADPNNAEGWYLMTQAYQLEDSISGLRDALSQCTDQVKSQPYYQVSYGYLLLQENKKDSAQLYFEQALDKTKGKDPDILLAISQAQVDAKTGDAQYAIGLMEKAIKRDKKNAALYTMMGNAYRKMGNGSEAYKSFQTAIDNNDQYAAALYRMGKIFLSQKNPEMYLKYFKQAIQADSNYAPALYELYYHYYFADAAKALGYFQQYLAKSDFKTINAYLYTDLLYLNKKYQQAIEIAQHLLNTPAGDSIPRLNKLVAYSYLELSDTSKAMSYMKQYFAKEADSNLVAKDFETMAELYSAAGGNEDSALAYNIKAVEVIKDSAARYPYYKKLSEHFKEKKDYSSQAKWLGKFYQNNPKTTNIDLFNWGVAHYKAEEYMLADTVFGTYIQKYPEQAFGYYWRARSNTFRDSAMQKGFAIPWYNQLISVIEKDTTNKTNRKWLVEAYGYLAAYETNEMKDYKKAIEWLQKILAIEPENKDALQYISTLQKKISSEMDTGSNRK